MTEYRYRLEKSSKKEVCPSCIKKTYVRYIDAETNTHLPIQYGRCDRESNCGYYLNPYKDGYVKGNKSEWSPKQFQHVKKVVAKPKTTFIPLDVLKQTLSEYENNVFIQNLLNRVSYPFNTKDIERVISLYNLGTIQSGYMNGAISFPFIDSKNNIRAIQVKQFDKTNHTTKTNFIHSILKYHYTNDRKPLPEWLKAYENNDTKVSCLFGEHLLNKYSHNPIALVEAPKSAIYSTLYFGLPKTSTDLIWLAVYNLSSLNIEKVKALKSRNVFLFPDLSKDGTAYKLWSNKAKEFNKQLDGTRFTVSDLLERLAPQKDRLEGNDLADFLIKQDWRKFRKSEPKKTPICVKRYKSEAPKTTYISQVLPTPTENKVLSWISEISKIEKYFNSIKLPTDPITLSQGCVINDCSLFIESHLTTTKANNGNNTYLPYLNRLRALKVILNNLYHKEIKVA